MRTGEPVPYDCLGPELTLVGPCNLPRISTFDAALDSVTSYLHKEGIPIPWERDILRVDKKQLGLVVVLFLIIGSVVAHRAFSN